jgi:hypothetical protein
MLRALGDIDTKIDPRNQIVGHLLAIANLAAQPHQRGGIAGSPARQGVCGR